MLEALLPLGRNSFTYNIFKLKWSRKVKIVWRRNEASSPVHTELTEVLEAFPQALLKNTHTGLTYSCAHHGDRRGSGCIASFILNLGIRWRWIACFMLRQLYLQWQSPTTNWRGAGWAQSQSGCFWEEKWPAGNRTTFRSSITCQYTDFAMQSKRNENLSFTWVDGQPYWRWNNQVFTWSVRFIRPIVRKIIWQKYPFKFPDVKFGEDLFSRSRMQMDRWHHFNMLPAGMSICLKMWIKT